MLSNRLNPLTHYYPLCTTNPYGVHCRNFYLGDTSTDWEARKGGMFKRKSGDANNKPKI